MTIDDVRSAAGRIADHVHRTPVATSATFDRELGARVVFKCENLQKVGAFKARGAVNAVLSLDAEAASRGVITHSSGNHAAALAYAASIREVPCAVVMPREAPPIKIAAVRGYGAEIVFCERSQRDAVCARERGERGATFIHPFDDDRIIAGQGTACLELVEQAGPFDLVLAPVGGGGLLAGTALAAGGADVYGAEPEAVDDAFRSLGTGVRQPSVVNPTTIADGLMTGLGERNFRILTERSVEIVTVGERAIVDAGRDILERMKLVVEPSAAVVLAALRTGFRSLRDLRVGVILSGGNTDFRWLR